MFIAVTSFWRSRIAGSSFSSSFFLFFGPLLVEESDGTHVEDRTQKPCNGSVQIFLGKGTFVFQVIPYEKQEKLSLRCNVSE